MNKLDKYECLVINNNSDTNKLEDQVYFYKAKLHKPFRMGSKEFWLYHAKEYDPNTNTSNISNSNYNKNSILDLQKMVMNI